MPGGGQAGLLAPPPPPPPDPEPIVVTATDTGATIEATAAGAPAQRAAEVDIATMQDHAAVRFERMADARGRSWRAAASVTPTRTALRLVVMRFLVERALTSLSVGARPGR